jgi:dsDNA-binding SOS-regulon protein
MIEIEYIVRDNKGAERLRTADKKAADAYDKALDNAERLQQLLRHDKVLPNLSDSDLEDLTIYLALNEKNVERTLKGKEPELMGAKSGSAPADNIEPLRTAKK